MKEHFSRQLGHHTYEFRRISFPESGTWYKIALIDTDHPASFWIKQGSSGRWKIQPCLLPEEVLQQESAFIHAILEQERILLYQ